MAFKYDFETALVRKGHDSYAEDHAPQPKEGFDYIPMAVADMGFIVCPSIVEKIKGRLEHPIFGYYGASPETEEWWKIRSASSTVYTAVTYRLLKSLHVQVTELCSTHLHTVHSSAT